MYHNLGSFVSGVGNPVEGDIAQACVSAKMESEHVALYGHPIEKIRAARTVIALRRSREAHFGPGLFFDPAWDILLTLYIAKIRQIRVKTSAAIQQSGVPSTTGLRWVATLCDRGYVTRSSNPTDSRCVLLELTDEAAKLIDRHLAETRDSLRTEC